MHPRGLPAQAGCPVAASAHAGTTATRCCRRRPVAPLQRHCGPVQARRRYRRRRDDAPATAAPPHLPRRAAPAAHAPTPAPAHCPPGRPPAAAHATAATLPRRCGPVPAAPAGGRHPTPAPPGSVRARRCRRPQSGARRPARDHPRPAVVRSVAHPRTSRPAACAPAPAARTRLQQPTAPNATPDVHGAPAATTSGFHGERDRAPDVRRRVSDAGARVPCVQGSRGSVKLSPDDAPR
ncbi:hypothetical protein D3C73_1077570 [compost metagenome]